MTERGNGSGGRGVVLAVEGRSALVLTPEGEFRRVPLDRPDRQVGDEMRLPGRRSWGWAPAVGGLAVAAALLLAVVLSGLPGGKGGFEGGTPPLLVEAYVSVDINPSVELGVSGSALVVEAEALNEDGRRLLTRVRYRGRPLADVLTALVGEAARAGYLLPGRAGDVVIAAMPARPGAVASSVVAAVYEGEVRARALLGRQGVQAAVYAVRSARSELRREARERGLSVGKYLMLEALRTQGVSVDPDELRQAGVGRVLRQRGVIPGEVLRKAVRDARRELEMELIGADEFEEPEEPGGWMPSSPRPGAGMVDGDLAGGIGGEKGSPGGEERRRRSERLERREGGKGKEGDRSERGDGRAGEGRDREKERAGEEGRPGVPFPEGSPMVIPEGEGGGDSFLRGEGSRPRGDSGPTSEQGGGFEAGSGFSPEGGSQGEKDGGAGKNGKKESEGGERDEGDREH